MPEKKELIFIGLVIFSIFLTIFVCYGKTMFGTIFDIVLAIVLSALVLMDYNESMYELFDKYRLGISKKEFVGSILLGIALYFAMVFIIFSLAFKIFLLLKGHVFMYNTGLFITQTRILFFSDFHFIKKQYHTLILYVVISFFVALFFEYVFRGVIYTNLTDLYGSSKAIIIQALLYSLFIASMCYVYMSTIHIVMMFLYALAFAVIMGMLREKLDSVSAPILTHFIFLITIVAFF